MVVIYNGALPSETASRPQRGAKRIRQPRELGRMYIFSPSVAGFAAIRRESPQVAGESTAHRRKLLESTQGGSRLCRRREAIGAGLSLAPQCPFLSMPRLARWAIVP